mmetsp:Transcript_18051/g.46144  ORF Transcript_18051/g.46144 Transcript_18051/m.46144 type:complete len:210 (-) Transcript_18051:185-814(-)
MHNLRTHSASAHAVWREPAELAVLDEAEGFRQKLEHSHQIGCVHGCESVCKRRLGVGSSVTHVMCARRLALLQVIAVPSLVLTGECPSHVIQRIVAKKVAAGWRPARSEVVDPLSKSSHVIAFHDGVSRRSPPCRSALVCAVEVLRERMASGLTKEDDVDPGLVRKGRIALLSASNWTREAQELLSYRATASLGNVCQVEQARRVAPRS